ncbi:MAG: alpha/beta fold hydrolase, partial [Planctomycetota bacterium]
GTRIVYRVGGNGERWLVIANGYGGTFCAWDDLLSHLVDRHRVLIWDYRGLHRSGLPRERANLRIEHHSRDLEALCAAEGIARMVLAGWSVGVQVALEHYRRVPASVTALVLVNGAHGRVIRRSMAKSPLRRLLGPGVRGIRRGAPLLQRTLLPALRRVVNLPGAGRAMRLARLVNGEAPSIVEAADAALRLDWATYCEMTLLADEHDTEDLLPRVAVPTLVIAGDRDLLTSTEVARGTAAAIPRARYHEIPGATHYGLMEFPEIYAATIAQFLAEI